MFDDSLATEPWLGSRRLDPIGRFASASGQSSQLSARLRSGQEFADAWDDLGAVQLDAGQEGLMGKTPHAVFQIEAVRAESSEVLRDLLRDSLW